MSFFFFLLCVIVTMYGDCLTFRFYTYTKGDHSEPRYCYHSGPSETKSPRLYIPDFIKSFFSVSVSLIPLFFCFFFLFLNWFLLLLYYYIFFSLPWVGVKALPCVISILLTQHVCIFFHCIIDQLSIPLPPSLPPLHIPSSTPFPSLPSLEIPT